MCVRYGLRRYGVHLCMFTYTRTYVYTHAHMRVRFAARTHTHACALHGLRRVCFCTCFYTPICTYIHKHTRECASLRSANRRCDQSCTDCIALLRVRCLTAIGCRAVCNHTSLRTNCEWARDRQGKPRCELALGQPIASERLSSASLRGCVAYCLLIAEA